MGTFDEFPIVSQSACDEKINYSDFTRTSTNHRKIIEKSAFSIYIYTSKTKNTVNDIFHGTYIVYI